MSSFEEFLQDYSAKETEERNRFLKRLKEGKVSKDEIYPPKSRFVKLKEPIAYTVSLNKIWGCIPLYGSTMINLYPFHDRKEFDESSQRAVGFTSYHLDKMIDLVKDTGRIQFILDGPPTYFKNLEFLEPLLNELKPPTVFNTFQSFIGDKTFRKYQIEFDTLANLGFTRFIDNVSPMKNKRMILPRLFYSYAGLKTMGYEELVDEMETLMTINPYEALKYLIVFGDLLVFPRYNLLKGISIFNRNDFIRAHELGRLHGINLSENISYEIGRFLLNKIVLYPETFEGCMKVIQEYDNYELYKVLGALDEGIKRKEIDIIESKKVDISEILDNVWKDANKIKMGTDVISFGASLNIGLIGELASGFSGIGVMAGLGFQAIDRFWGVKSEYISEIIAKFVRPNYLVTVYDFKKKHTLND
jgi:hypothetical protein